MSFSRAVGRLAVACTRRTFAVRRFTTAETRTVNGIVYTGTFEGARLQQGSMQLLDGREYSGHFGDDGQLVDVGTMRFAGGTYTGQFKDWARHGEGRTEYATGKLEVGTYAANTLIRGTVTAAGPSGEPITLEGDWQGGHLVRGTLRRPGMTYAGAFRGSVPHGEGETAFDNGVKHKGHYANGRFHGEGSLVTAKGDVYRGTFQDGKLLEGTLQYMDGSRYEGQFNDQGELHGEGVYEHAPSGNSYTGHWERGKFKSGQVLDKDGYPAELVTDGIRISDFQM
eukprot:EG_transcript_18691